MRVRMLVAMPEGGACDGQPWPRQGEVAEFPPNQAAHFIASGIAEDAKNEPAEEVTDDVVADVDERPAVRRKR
ncbi:hypothetical protein PV350_23505 [Streptomyces sp. PA03-6a]|nr:hypothetical protein [Streptomyces sp. PA03-6a]